MLEQLVRERDLVGVGDDTALEPEIAIIALHFGRHAECRICDPAAERAKRFAPDSGELRVRARETIRPPEEFPIGIQTRFPVGQFFLRSLDRVAPACVPGAIDFAEIDVRACPDFSGPKKR